MGGGNHHRPQLMEGDGGKPILVVALKHHHHPRSLADARPAEDIGHPVALPPELAEGEAPLLSLGIAPDEGDFLRGFLCQGVHNIVAKVEIPRIVQGEAQKPPLPVGDFLGKPVVNAHKLSFAPHTALEPIRRKRSYRLDTRSESWARLSSSSSRRARMRW